MRKADIGIIGGSEMERLLAATRLRRAGISVHCEYKNRHHRKMYDRAAAEAEIILDLDNARDLRMISELPDH